MLKWTPHLPGISPSPVERAENVNDNYKNDQKRLIERAEAASVAAQEKGHHALAALFMEWARELKDVSD